MNFSNYIPTSNVVLRILQGTRKKFELSRLLSRLDSIYSMFVSYYILTLPSLHQGLYTLYIILLQMHLFTQTPESPVWLLSRNRPEEAKKSLAYLRGCVSTADVEDEFSELSIYAGFNKSVDLEQYADCGIDQRRLSYVKYLQINTNDTTNGKHRR